MTRGHEEALLPADVDLDEVSRTYMALGGKRGAPTTFRRLLGRTPIGEWLDDRDERRARALERHLTGRAIGAKPGRWGVLSGDEIFNVEAALDRLDQSLLRHRAPDDEGPELVRVCLDAVGHLRRQVPFVRASAHLGDDAAEAPLTRDLARLAERVRELNDADGHGPLRDPNGGIEFFLPIRYRHPSTHLSEVSDRNKPVDVFVGPQGESLRLGWISVPVPLRRQGAGSAALADLCVFADRTGRAITACFDPEAGGEDWLARWYDHHLFRPAGGAWRRGDEITRLPQR